MRVPLRWLREFVDTTATADEIAHRLTMAGTEVGGIMRIGAAWDRIVIGRVAEIERHPQADNLFVATIDIGSDRLTLVTAAPNLRAGNVVPVVQAGGRLAPGAKIEARRFRGIGSQGMLCSGDELGVSPDKDTIYVLEDDAPIGADLSDYLADEVLDIELTPNRPDCLGVIGIAREVAAVMGAGFQAAVSPPPTGGQPVADFVRVFVDDSDLCPRYTAAFLEDARVGPSPAWLQRRLHLSGMRPINNVVDVTNYVMLEMGQPLHAFDADKVQQRTIRVRRARERERITTIDGVVREAVPDTLVIADAHIPIALAGIMGGLDSEISETTSRIILESATFDARNIRRTSRGLRLSTEASKRFDKGLDPRLPPSAAFRACALLAQVAGAAPAAGLADVSQPRPDRPHINFTVGDVARLIGQPYAAEHIESTLRPLGFEVRRNGESFDAVVPSWRDDVEGKADIAEEVARIIGYDTIPTVLPSGQLPRPLENSTLRWEEMLRTALAAAGLQEVITYSLIDPFALSRLDAARSYPPPGPDADVIAVFNPMSSDQSRLRTMLLPSLLATLAGNMRHQERVCIFEIAHVFLPPLSPLPREERRLAIAMAGRRAPEAWNTDTAPFDFFDLKAAVETAFRALHVPMAVPTPEKAPWLHPTQGASILAEGHADKLGDMGQVHPLVAARFDIEGVTVYAAECNLEPLLRLAREEIVVHPLPRFPAVQRDLALVAEERFSHEQVASTIRSAGGPLLENVRLFDVYTQPPIPAGHRSLAYTLTFRAPDRTLTDEVIAPAMEAIEIAVRRELEAQIRGREEGR